MTDISQILLQSPIVEVAASAVPGQTIPISLKPKSHKAPFLAGMTLENNDDAYKVTLSFGPSGDYQLKIHGRFNRTWGKYNQNDQDKGKVSFDSFKSTKMLPENQIFERRVANFLKDTSKVEMNGSDLVFLDKNDRILMRFKPKV